MSTESNRTKLWLLLVLGCSVCLRGQQITGSLADARLYVDRGRFAQAEAALHQYLADHASSADAHFLLGYVLFRTEKAKESLAEFTEGAKYRRPGADELKIVASDYVMLGDFSDADKWFSEVVAEKPQDADAWYLLGRTKYNENDLHAAIASFQHALVLRPRHVETENNLGLCWKELSQPEKAEAAFETAIQWEGNSPGDAQPFLNLGTVLAERNDDEDLKKALSYLAEANALSPNNPKIHEALAGVYLAQKDLAKAQSELERAVALAPETSALHFKLAQVYRKLGMRDQAQEQFEICSKLSSAHSSNKTPNPLEVEKAPPR